ncbi:MAG: type I secretion C-terminal target domain-containing protein, partial [Rhizobiales bacterium]|nr:type I secretion C-terminal target domain-containing protein [Hyphomicrobiales bacterium]
DGNDQIYGGYDNDTLYGDAGTDTLHGGTGDDTLYGGDDADDLRGNTGNDTLYGEAGNDTLYGDWHWSEYGDDTLYGGDGADTLYGGASNDNLEGGAGADTLYGESGADTFLFMSATAFDAVDTVKDFSTGQSDKIDISDVLDIAGYEHGVDTLTDWVQIVTNGSHSELRVDVTGSASFGSGTQIALIENVTGLTDEAALVSSGHLLVA